ncbi:hypothetical protein EOPP23_02510 [Endozoicomonas sp. OPT23]|uniref:TetR/AcrR family transcriptional regulator n=1 Tax=Endozoicomonas sp. OPT23 TaxID=2072845 RepID=UPI00129A0B61|nr:TetR family transcriptional regulator [Endozoicomonas sp. OPT23]MRI31868.1 hypothetical protein [Endozoicomonas sp. OPT23]
MINQQVTLNRREPTQQRSRKIVAAIVQACRKILKNEGPDALNTNYIAEVAEVNIGSLYRWFDNKESIVAYTYELMVAEEIDSLMPLFNEISQDVKPDEAIVYMVDTLLTAQKRFVKLHQYFYQQHQSEYYVGSQPYIDGQQSWMQATGQWISDVIGRHHSELSPEQCRFKAFILTRAIEGVMLSAVTDDPDILEQEKFREELLKLALLYLFSRD